MMMLSTLRLTFSADIPWWAWVLLGLSGVILAIASVPRAGVARSVGRSLVLCRLGVIAVALLILAGPTWTSAREEVRPDVVSILLDTSGSMTRVEQGASRFEAMIASIDALSSSPDEGRRLEWFSFSEDLVPLSPSEDGSMVVPSPGGGPTRIGASIIEVLDRHVGDRVAGVVVLTDGRGDLDEAAGALRRAGAGAWVLPLGDHSPPPDVSLEQVIAPKTAFNEDRIPVQVMIERKAGPTEGGAHEDLFTIRLVDAIDGRELSVVEQTIAPGSPQVVPLQIEPGLPGLARWRIELLHGGRVLSEELIEVDIRDRPLRLLYVEGKPRFLYRFAAPMFTRERSIDVSILLQSADQDAAPDGDVPIRRLPTRGSELQPYDLVLLGDVDPRGFTEEQLLAVRDHVVDGAGLLWISGSSTDPALWADTPMAELLPVPARTGRKVVSGKLRSSREGDALGLAPPLDLPLDWAIDVESSLPQARTLMHLETSDGRLRPGFLLLPTGKGRVGWLATDDMWRWRQEGEADHGGAMLLGIIRLLARGVAPESPTIRVIPDPVAGRVATVLLEGVVDEPGGPHDVEITDDRDVLREHVRLTEDPDAGVWRGLWTPDSAGVRQVALTLGDQVIQREVLVHSRDPEDMRPGADIPSLEQLANVSGGGLITHNDLEDLLETIPNRTVTIHRLHDAGPALSWLLWGVLIALLGTEWGLRRWNALA